MDSDSRGKNCVPLGSERKTEKHMFHLPSPLSQLEVQVRTVQKQHNRVCVHNIEKKNNSRNHNWPTALEPSLGHGHGLLRPANDNNNTTARHSTPANDRLSLERLPFTLPPIPGAGPRPEVLLHWPAFERRAAHPTNEFSLMCVAPGRLWIFPPVTLHSGRSRAF